MPRLSCLVTAWLYYLVVARCVNAAAKLSSCGLVVLLSCGAVGSCRNCKNTVGDCQRRHANESASNGMQPDANRCPQQHRDARKSKRERASNNQAKANGCITFYTQPTTQTKLSETVLMRHLETKGSSCKQKHAHASKHIKQDRASKRTPNQERMQATGAFASNCKHTQSKNMPMQTPPTVRR